MTGIDAGDKGTRRPLRAGRIVLIYFAAASVWIVWSSALVDRVAEPLTIAPHVLEIGKGLLFVGVTSGILFIALRRWSERVRAAALAEVEAAERLRRADVMRATFLTGISHELRTPLTAIAGYAETIHQRAQGLSAEQVEQLGERLAASARQLERLVVDLLDIDLFAQGLVRPRAAVTDLRALVLRVVSSTDVGGRQVHVEGDEVPAIVDGAKVERAVAHLLDNAVRHTPDTTTVLVRVESHDDAEATILVEDDGEGFPPAVVGELFDPFVQGPDAASRPSPGLGIGLTFVAQVAALHGGIARAEPSGAGGARVVVSLRSPEAASVGAG